MIIRFKNAAYSFILFVGYYNISSFSYFGYAKSFTSPEVKITSGIIRGSMGTSRDGREYYQFMGIPYAQPPVGILRFESPLPALKWKGIRWADKSKGACLQLNIVTGFLTGSEDCLYINVYVPKVSPTYYIDVTNLYNVILCITKDSFGI